MYEVVATGRGGVPAKNKTQARKILADLAREYREQGFHLTGNVQMGGYLGSRGEERIGITVRPDVGELPDFLTEEEIRERFFDGRPAKIPVEDVS